MVFLFLNRSLVNNRLIARYFSANGCAKYLSAKRSQPVVTNGRQFNDRGEERANSWPNIGYSLGVASVGVLGYFAYKRLYRINYFANRGVLPVIQAEELKSKDRLMDTKNTMIDIIPKRKSPIKVIQPADITEKLEDVAGCEQAKLEVIEVVSSLSEAKHYKELGTSIPKCALIRGSTGVGKSLLVRAVAAEAGVPLVMVSSSALIERQTDSRSRIDELFEITRSIGPCIVFIDEFEFIGRKRCGSNSDQENSLDQLLSQLDELNANDRVVVLAVTTKFKSDLDPALFDEYRFKEFININVPWSDPKRLAAIYKVHLRNIKVSPDEDKDRIAARLASLSSFGGREVAEVCQSAARLAARDMSPYVEIKHLEEAVERKEGWVGDEETEMTAEKRQRTAYHEAGHAICVWFLEHASTFINVTVKPRGTRLGCTNIIRGNRHDKTKEVLLADMCVGLGGLVAEEVFYSTHSTGAGSDLKALTELAYKQITEHGMGDVFGPFFVDYDRMEKSQPYSADTKKLIDEEVRALIATALERTRQLISEHKSDIEKVVNKLLEKEALNREDLVELLGERPFADCFPFEELVESTRNSGPKPLPKGLEGWNRIEKHQEQSEEASVKVEINFKYKIDNIAQMSEIDKVKIEQDLISKIKDIVDHTKNHQIDANSG